MNKTLRDFGLGVTTVAGLWGASAFAPTEQIVGEARSSQWPKVRAVWLEEHGECVACGQKDHLNVHHVIPFNDAPSRELDPDNLVTLCTDGPGHCNCHLLFGHLGNYQSKGNPNVRRDAARFREMLKTVKFD